MENIAKALVAFRSKCPTIKFDSTNPHFKSRFASLAAIHAVIDPILSENGLTVMQFPIASEGRAGCRTVVMHESGEYLSGDFAVPTAKNDPQGACAAVSYARRYGISGALGLVTEEDDDGESAMGRRDAIAKPNRQPEPRKAKAPAMSAANRDKLKHAAGLRLKETIGDDYSANEVMGVLTDVAKGFGFSSPIELTDYDYGPALAAVQKWEPVS